MAESAPQGLLAHPLAPWIAVLAAPMLAAGYGADQAVTRTGMTPAAVAEIVEEKNKPIQADLEAAAHERKAQGRQLDKIEDELHALTRALAAQGVGRGKAQSEDADLVQP